MASSQKTTSAPRTVTGQNQNRPSRSLSPSLIRPSQKSPSRGERGQSYTLIIEEAKGLPLLWNGKAPVSKIRWRLTPDDLKFTLMTIGEVLEKFAAQDYLRYASVTMSANGTQGISTIRLSDSFATLFRSPPSTSSAKEYVVKLIIAEVFRVDASKEISTKHILVITELNKKQVLWDGRKPVRSMIARVTEAQMIQSVQTVLKKYLPTDYIKKDMKIQLVMDKRVPSAVRDVDLEHLLGTIFQGTSASIRIWNQDTTDHNSNDGAKSDKSETELEAFDKRSLESFWLSGSWTDIREKIHSLFENLETVIREKEVPPYYHDKLTEEKRSLETSMRRRNRSIEEVWQRYELLKITIQSAGENFKTKPELTKNFPQTSTVVPPQLASTSSSSRAAMEAIIAAESNEISWDHMDLPIIRTGDEEQTSTQSCLDIVAQNLRHVGFEIYDEEQRLNHVTGVAITVAVVVTICIISHYM